MTLNDLNTTLSQSVDISTNDFINTDLKTNIVNQNLSNNNLIPSIQNVILLKNKYEVLKVDKDFSGTLKELIRQQGKKMPSEIPFINILLVGGGSSGGWIYKGKTGYTSPNENNDYWIGNGVAGEIVWVPYFKDLSLDTVLDITIGQGGNSKSKEIWKTGSYESNSEQFLPNAGKSSYIKWNNNIIQAFGGYENYLEIKDNIITENIVGGLSSILPFQGDDYYKIIVPCNKSGEYVLSNPKRQYYDLYNEYDLKKTYNNKYQKLYYNENINHHFPPLFPFEYSIYKYIGNIGLNMIMVEKSWHYGSSDSMRTMTYQYLIQDKCSINDIEYIKRYLESIRISLKNRPTSGNTHNNYGCCHSTRSGQTAEPRNVECIFFNGLDAIDFGMGGLSGSYAWWYEEDENGDFQTYYQRGYMGKGGDGVCYIYYPKEV